MPIFFAICTHLLTRTQEKRFEDVFLVKITNKGTSSSFMLDERAGQFYKAVHCKVTR